MCNRRLKTSGRLSPAQVSISQSQLVAMLFEEPSYMLYLFGKDINLKAQI